MRERAKSGARKKKSERGRGEAEKEMVLSASPFPLSLFFCPRPTFRALSHRSRFDSRRSPRGKDETTRSLAIILVSFLSKLQN